MGVDVLYASATGNAEEIARRIHAELSDHGLEAGLLVELNQFVDAGWPLSPTASGTEFAGKVCVLVASTTGDGDVPANGTKVLRYLRDKAKPKKFMQGLRYCILGLGDTNFENFCNSARRIDKALLQAGAENVYLRGEADDGTGLEEVVEPWIDGLWDKLLQACSNSKGVPAPAKENGSEKIIPKETGAHENGDTLELPHPLELRVQLSVDSGDPAQEGTGHHKTWCASAAVRDMTVFNVSISAARRLTAVDLVDRRVWHAELDCSEIQFSYRPGDTVGVVPQNRDEHVDQLLKRVALPVGLSLEEVDTTAVKLVARDGGRQDIVRNVSLRTCFRDLVSLADAPKKTLLVALAQFCSDVADKRAMQWLASKEGREDYRKRIMAPGGWGILSVLDSFPSCLPSAELLLDQLPALAPRYYSAASSPKADPTRFHFAFSTVLFPDGQRGLVTGMLEDMCSSVEAGAGAELGPLRIVLGQKDHFRPPADLATPMIMIGPGTGIAPFRGFLRERQAQIDALALKNGQSAGVRGDAWLFFGCRHKDKDFLYDTELAEFVDSGVLTRLTVAFSRDSADGVKTYVQHRLLEEREQVLARLLAPGECRLYLCGDGGAMVRGVEDALCEILAPHTQNDLASARVLLKEWEKAGRYRKDVWHWG
ncbi:Methionine synthase reductase [Porphyridium purpureum]|uniref:Methionine synthase reductase n=1 Tax=Porphyridium purpureum TaxID=35688 RepID=A0A5J4YWV3_PORPP|nr:Methionine synthase reductase [Porphyridium purpureum]|eukprot:POR9311..scf227_4